MIKDPLRRLASTKYISFQDLLTLWFMVEYEYIFGEKPEGVSLGMIINAYAESEQIPIERYVPIQPKRPRNYDEGYRPKGWEHEFPDPPRYKQVMEISKQFGGHTALLNEVTKRYGTNWRRWPSYIPVDVSRGIIYWANAQSAYDTNV